MLIDRTLPLGVQLEHALAWIGAVAANDARGPEIAAVCRRLMQELGGVEVTVQVPVVAILCDACDELRRRGQAIDGIDELIRLLKGGQQRLVSGGLRFTAENVSRLDDKLEDLRKIVIASSRNGG
jgi:hypothetical protein